MNDLTELVLPTVAQELMASFEDMTLPSSDSVSLWALEKKRKIYIDRDIAEDLIEIQRLILRWNMEDKGKEVSEREPIWVYVMSYGGDMDYMWMLLDTISVSKTPVYTVNLGVAASAASLIFLSGQKRFMMPRARLVIHEGSAQMAGDAVKVMDQTESYKKMLKQMKDYILSRTQIPRQQLMKKRNNDWELDASYCLEHGACDYIVDAMDEIM